MAFTKHLVVSGAPFGIRAVSISPGMIRTPATSAIIDDPGSPLHELIELTPSPRVGEPAEVAALAAFLASDEATHINGADIAMDGGITAITR